MNIEHQRLLRIVHKLPKSVVALVPAKIGKSELAELRTKAQQVIESDLKRIIQSHRACSVNFTKSRATITDALIKE